MTNLEVITYKNKNTAIHFYKIKDSLWLDLESIALLFEDSTETIQVHIDNILKDKELPRSKVCSKVQNKKGKSIKIYNLDMIIHIGYRTNPLATTQFRIWATNILGRKNKRSTFKNNGINPNHNKSIIIYNTEDEKVSVSLFAKDGNVWMNQTQIAELFDTSKQNISLHVQNILKEKELKEETSVKEYLTDLGDGRKFNITFYNLDMILAIGFRVKSIRGTQFRKWANQNLKEYMIKGFVMDDERLKNPDGRPDYFDELLARIRDIRASEKRFYQKLRDLFALSSDYDKTDKATQMFFAETQNKLLYAVTGQTAAEIITSRADPKKPNMGLTSWQGKIVRKGDISIAKNYLKKNELDDLNRLVTIFLEIAELRVKNRQDIDMKYWKENVDEIIQFNEKDLLKNKGKISNREMEKIVKKRYEEFNDKRKKIEARLADEEDMKELEMLEDKIEKGGL